MMRTTAAPLALALSALAAAPAAALACGGPYGLSLEQLTAQAVSATVNQHFQAIQAGDQEALDDLWLTRSATVSRLDAATGEADVTVPVRRSIQLWSAAPEPEATWEILDVSSVSEDTWEVKAELVWRGDTYNETLTLVSHRGDWRLAGKTYTTTAAAAVPVTGGRPTVGY